MMSATTHHDGKRFKLVATSNCAAYHLTDKLTGRDVFLQGDDAVCFELDREAIEAKRPDADPEFVMGWLWDQRGWGMASCLVGEDA